MEGTGGTGGGGVILQPPTSTSTPLKKSTSRTGSLEKSRTGSLEKGKTGSLDRSKALLNGSATRTVYLSTASSSAKRTNSNKAGKAGKGGKGGKGGKTGSTKSTTTTTSSGTRGRQGLINTPSSGGGTAQGEGTASSHTSTTTTSTTTTGTGREETTTSTITTGTGGQKEETTTTTTLTTGRGEDPTPSPLQRSDSGRSLGALSYQQYDPKTTGSLSRSEEVNISLYDQGPFNRSYEDLQGASYHNRRSGGSNTRSSEYSTEDLRQIQQHGGGVNTTTEVVWGQEGQQEDLTTSPYRSSSTGDTSTPQVNGHTAGYHTDYTGGESSTTTTTTTGDTSYTGGDTSHTGGGVSSSEMRVTERSVSTVSDDVNLSATGEALAGTAELLVSPTRPVSSIQEDGTVTTTVTTSDTTSPTSSMQRNKKTTSRPRKPGVGSTGSFQMRSASNSLPRSETPKSPAASDESFKTSLQDTLTRNGQAGNGETSTVHTTTTTTTVTKQGGAASGSKRTGGTPKASSTDKDVGTPARPTSAESKRMSRTDSVASTASTKKTRGSTELSKRESTRSTTSTTSTSAGDPGRPPSGKSGRLSRTNSTSDPASPRGAATTLTTPASPSTQRTDSQRSTTSIKASSLERLAEPKRRVSVEKRERLGSSDSATGGRRTSGSQSPAPGRKGSSKKADSSPVVSRSSSKEGQRSSSNEGQRSSVARTTSGASTTEKVTTGGGAAVSRTTSGASQLSSTENMSAHMLSHMTSGKVSRSASGLSTTSGAATSGGSEKEASSVTVTKTDSTRSTSSPRGGFAATTAASSAKRSDSTSSKQSKPSSRTSSGATRGKFSIKAAGTSTGATVSPPGSVFDINVEPTTPTAIEVDTKKQSTSRTPSNASQRKVTAALSRASSKGAEVKDAQRSTEVKVTRTSSATSTSGGKKPERTSSIVKAENQHRAISKSLFSELHAKRGAGEGQEGAQATGKSIQEEVKSTTQEVTVSESLQREDQHAERGAGVGAESVSSVTTSVSSVTPGTVTGDSVTYSSVTRDSVTHDTVTPVTESVITTTETTVITTTSNDTETDRGSSLLEKRGSKRDSLNLDLSSVQTPAADSLKQETTTTTTSSSSSRGRSTDRVTSPSKERVVSPGRYRPSDRPLSPSVEDAHNNVTHGTVGNLVKGKFKDLNLTARLLDANTPERKPTNGSKEEGEKKYKWQVEGIDVPGVETLEEATSGVQVQSVQGETGEEVYTAASSTTTTLTREGTTDTDYDPTASNTSTLGPTSPDSDGGGSLERTHRPKRGFTYLLDESLAKEVTRRATNVTARRPHVQADLVQEHKISTLERDKEEKAIKDVRAKLTKTPTPLSPTSPPPEQQLAFSSVLKGIKQRNGHADRSSLIDGREESTEGREEGVITTSTQYQALSSGRPRVETVVTTAEVHHQEPPSGTTSHHSTTKTSTTTSVVKDSSPEEVHKGVNSAHTSVSTERKEATDMGSRMKLGADTMGQLSPDSAYQSDTTISPTLTPAYDNLREMKLHNGVGTQHGAPQEVTVQRVQQEETVGQGAGSRYRSKNIVQDERHQSSKVTGGVATTTSSTSRAYSSTSSKVTSTGGGVQEEEPYMVTTRRNDSITKVGGDENNNSPGGSTTYTSSRTTDFKDRFRPAPLEDKPIPTTPTRHQAAPSPSTGRRVTSGRPHRQRTPGGSRQVQEESHATHTTTTTTSTSRSGVVEDLTTHTGGVGVGGVSAYPVADDVTHSPPPLTTAEVHTTTTTGLSTDRTLTADRADDVLLHEQTTARVDAASTADSQYLPVAEDGGVHLTVGPTHHSTTTTTTYTTDTEHGAAGGGNQSGTDLQTGVLYSLQGEPAAAAAGAAGQQQQADGSSSSSSLLMRPSGDNKENLSASVQQQQRSYREAHYTTTTSSSTGGGYGTTGGSERRPLGGGGIPSLHNTPSELSSRSGSNRVIPLAPLSVDINSHNDSFEMATHPTSITSPTVKHATTMYEMSEFADRGGYYDRGMQQQQQGYDGYYDGPYGGGSLPHSHSYSAGGGGSRYALGGRHPPAGHLEDGLDFQNLHNLRNTYQEQTLSSQQSYRSHLHDVTDGSGGGFDTVSRSFRHIPGTPSGPKYPKVDPPTYPESGGFRSGIRGYQGRQHQDGYVSRTYVEGDSPGGHYGGQYGGQYGGDMYGDGDSVQSEPVYGMRTRRSEKLLSNRRPARRQASSTSGGSSMTLPSRHVRLGDHRSAGERYADYHQHSLQDSPRGGYSSLQDPPRGTSSTLRSARSYTTLTGGEPAISPELRDAQKMRDPFGNEYHITLKLNQHGTPGSVSQSRGGYSEDHSLQYQQQGNQYNSTMSLPDMYPATRAYHHDDSYLHTNRYYGDVRDVRDEGYGGSPTRTITQVELDSSEGRQQFEDRLSWYRARKAQQEAALHSSHHVEMDMVDVGGSRVSSIHHRPTPPPSTNGDLSMSLGQSMTMDYMPTKPRTHTETMTVRAEKPSTTNIYIQEDRPPPRSEHRETFTQEVIDTHEEEEDMPKVVRGSILIKNNIDTTGTPKVFDVVADDEGDENWTVEDNTNLFHGQYLQARENPMYNSDEDLSKLARRPAFTRIFRENEDYTEIPVDYTSNRKGRGSKTTTTTTTTTASSKSGLKGKGRDYFVNSRDQTDLNSTEIHERMIRTRGMPPVRDVKRSTEMEIARLIRNAPADSVKQRINVEREEEEIMGPLPVNHADGTGGDPSGMLNFDTVSEKVDVGLSEGVAQLAVKVRCERIVPIRGVDDLFKKSSVIVTRLIEIDLGVTEERKRLYDNVMRGGSGAQMMLEGEGGSRRGGSKGERKLGTKETFKLYKMFMGIAEAEEGKTHDRLNIEQRIEEDKRLPDGAEFDFDTEGIQRDGFDFDDNLGFDTDELDNRLEHQINKSSKGRNYSGVKLEAMPGGRGHLMKNPEPDTISYISQASEQSDLLY